jgi:hypothetical protein
MDERGYWYKGEWYKENTTIEQLGVCEHRTKELENKMGFHDAQTAECFHRLLLMESMLKELVDWKLQMEQEKKAKKQEIIGWVGYYCDGKPDRFVYRYKYRALKKFSDVRPVFGECKS